MSTKATARTKGSQKIPLDEHNFDALAKNVTAPIEAPSDVITDAITDWVKVGEGSLVRIQVAADTYVAFAADDTGGAVTVATSPAIKLAAGYHTLRATGDFIRASAVAVRLEVRDC